MSEEADFTTIAMLAYQIKLRNPGMSLPEARLQAMDLVADMREEDELLSDLPDWRNHRNGAIPLTDFLEATSGIKKADTRLVWWREFRLWQYFWDDGPYTMDVSFRVSWSEHMLREDEEWGIPYSHHRLLSLEFRKWKASHQTLQKQRAGKARHGGAPSYEPEDPNFFSLPMAKDYPPVGGIPEGERRECQHWEPPVGLGRFGPDDPEDD